MKEKTKKTFEVIGIIAGVLFGGASFIWNWYTSHELEEVDFANQAIEYRPMIKMVGKPRMVRMRIEELNIEHQLPIDPNDVWRFDSRELPKSSMPSHQKNIDRNTAN